MGTAADENGRFVLTLNPGSYRIRISAVGFLEARREVMISEGSSVNLHVELEERIIESGHVVVTGTLRESYVSDSPVKVEVVPRAVIERSNTSNLVDALNYVSGLQVQVECGICYTNNIRINGMDGPYTSVLIDGMPIMSSLATVYGLNSISPVLVRQVEVIRGPASTLYGSEALAGVINIRTQRPDLAPRFFVQTRSTSDAEISLDASAAFGSARSGGFVSATGTWMDRFVDANGDGFSDVPLTRSMSVFGKYERSDLVPTTELAARVFFEERWGGQRGGSFADRGSDAIYGEAISTRRLELIGAHRFGDELRWKIDAAYNLHDQDSFYGDVPFFAQQHSAFTMLTWSGDIAADHRLLAGAAGRFEAYSDDTPVTNTDRQRVIPGIFSQLESDLTDRLTLVGGLRLDHHGSHGLIASPRLSARYKRGDLTTLRLNSGTGFRVVNLFTEDHAAISGSRQIVLAEELQPERSWNVSLSVNHIVPFGVNPLVIDIDVFHTRFSNQILPDYDSDARSIIYSNLDGYGVTQGISANISQSFGAFPLEYSIGMTLLDARTVEAGERHPILLSPRAQAIASATYRDAFSGIQFDYTGRFMGRMRMPSYPEPFSRPENSRPFSVHNLLMSRKISHYQSDSTHRDIEIFAGVNNIFDFVQPSPLIDPADPFGDHFDTNYIYGPLRGRTFSIGARFLLE